MEPEAERPTAVQLPSSVRLRQHHPLLRRAEDGVQLGLGQRDGVEIAGLSPEMLRFVLALPTRDRATPIELVRLAVEHGAAPGEALALLKELYAQGALLDADQARRMVSARRATCVLVEGAGPLLAPVAVGLALGGIGTLELRTSGWVSTDELGIFSASELGLPRAEAVRDMLGRVSPRTLVHLGASRTRLDLVVFTDSLRPRPARHQDLLADGVSHLVVRVSDGLGLVGPLVLPGRTACLRCLDLQHGARDPAWPTVAADLVERSGSAGPATLAATAAFAVEQALLAVDSVVSSGAPPAVLDAVLELDLSRGAPRRRQWSPHPRCGCGAGHTPSTERSDEGSTSDGEPFTCADQRTGGPAACTTVVDG